MRGLRDLSRILDQHKTENKGENGNIEQKRREKDEKAEDYAHLSVALEGGVEEVHVKVIRIIHCAIGECGVFQHLLVSRVLKHKVRYYSDI